MGRRRRYQGNGATSDWATQFMPVWPIVQRTAQCVYVSRLSPRSPNQGGLLQPTDLQAILKVSDEPALHWLRGSSPYAGETPSFSGLFPSEPVEPGPAPPSSAEPRWTDYAPARSNGGFFANLKDVLSGASSARESVARKRFNTATELWRRERRQREYAERSHRSAVETYVRNKKDYCSKRDALNAELAQATDRFKIDRAAYEAARRDDEAAAKALLSAADSGEAGDVEALAVQLLATMQLPIHLPPGSEARFDADDGILLYTLYVPNMEQSGLAVRLKTKERPATEKEIRAAQEFVVHALPLRIMHEVFSTPELKVVKMVGINMRLRYVERRTGQGMDEIIGSLAATAEEWRRLNIAEVDPKLCFRTLKGVASPSFQDISPVRPILVFDRDDTRIVESREIADALAPDTNLAAMDWEDFEHIVRELFAKMFAARSDAAEVHVTRASRDYGVDALVHDPDPIHGGKFVIQAKRYVNTVDVAAVRDLFGTLQNEGANRGYLVTTSTFGPDAHAFAKGKPLSLIDGSHLLRLLKDHGYSFRINLQEARQQLHAR